jgi:hypothetical protein
VSEFDCQVPDLKGGQFVSATRRKLAILAIVTALSALGAGSAFGKIQDVCTNPGGNQPAGQQAECQGAAHTQESVNPAGHAPPGQN